MLAAAKLTLTEATGTGVTVSVALLLFPSLVAVTTVLPAVSPVSRPAASTVAIA
jgi:hypothetical protein